ncbi:NAD(P)-dependent oxidoreductase [Phytohabitans kaempferiae]|uniref:NAD(P)-dependent oxidoreductase n=1 Tax=Phytohabitans kaempferiae TaxID=1620943 RepID=A0ABV6M2Y5_9ACTN
MAEGTGLTVDRSFDVAVVGLGNMGLGIALNLRDSGYRVVGVDPRGADLPVEDLEVMDHVGAWLDAEVVVLSLHPDVTGEVVRAVTELDGRPSVVVDCGTGTAELSNSLAQACTGAGITYVEAPVSGGPAAARNGTLAIFVGSEEALSEVSKGVVDAMGAAERLGPVGAGQEAKLINNLLVGAAFAAVAEAFALARATQIDTNALLTTLTRGAADSWVLRDAWPRMLAGDIAPRGTVELHRRDLGLVGDLAANLGVELRLNPAVAEMFGSGLAAGLGPYAQHALYLLWDEGAVPSPVVGK